MNLEEDIREMKSGINELKRRPLSVGRSGLYILVAVTMISSIKTCKATQDDDQNSQNVIFQDVIGNSSGEKFYEINGRRVYLEIDGQPVEEYVNRITPLSLFFVQLN